MHNKVVFRAAAALNEVSVVTLRINFRSVGQSTGQHDEGRGELDDARAGLEYLLQQYPNLPVIVCGFSFGARVGMQMAVQNERVQFLISIGTPLEKYDFQFLKQCEKPLLFVHGERDEFGDSETLRQFVSEVSAAASTELVIIPDADHFFEGHLDELKRA